MATTRDAIVISGWSWRTNGTPERVALALSRAGWRILYCENPASFIRRHKQERFPLADRIEGFRPRHVGHRLNALSSVAKWQAKVLINQIVRQARDSGFINPIVIYPDGESFLAVAREWKARGFFSVYLNLDYLQRVDHQALAAVSDLSLVIPPINYGILKPKFGGKVHLLPQLGPDLTRTNGDRNGGAPSATLEQIPRPRLGYVGNPAPTVDVVLLSKVLAAHPGWHFVACGPLPALSQDNVHDVGWLDSDVLPAVVALLDVGFMPYNLRNQQIRNGVSLKLFDYFAAGLPVVSTPLVQLREYGDLLYLGNTAEELASGVRCALAEPPDDPRREERRRVARAHSIGEMSQTLSAILVDALAQHSHRHSPMRSAHLAAPHGACQPGQPAGDED